MQIFAPHGNKPAVAAVQAQSGRSVPRRSLPPRAVLAGLMIVPMLAASALAAEVNPLADKVRGAGERFADVAVATSEGYSPIPCTSGIDGGAMGIHYVNAKLIDDKIDIAHPEAVMYEPGADGKLTLVGVEYISTKGPASLGGQLFSFTNAPNRYGLPPFYELHVWAWRANAKGTFADMNPDVSCAAAMGDDM